MKHFVYMYMHTCMCAKLLQACFTLCDPVDCSLLGSSVHGILQARILKWVSMPSSRGFSKPRDQTYISWFPALTDGFFTTSTTWEAHTSMIFKNTMYPRFKKVKTKIISLICEVLMSLTSMLQFPYLETKLLLFSIFLIHLGKVMKNCFNICLLDTPRCQ